MSTGAPALVLMPDMGRPQGRLPPVDVDFIYPDPPTSLDVKLLVFNNHDDPRGRHWAVVWEVEDKADGKHHVLRHLEIVQEIGFNHLTNWGPISKTLNVAAPPVPIAFLHLAQLTLEDRRKLEAIARETGVYVPNGNWNGQDWIEMVLRQAVTQGLFAEEDVHRALHAAKARGALFETDNTHRATPIASPSRPAFAAAVGILGAHA